MQFGVDMNIKVILFLTIFFTVFQGVSYAVEPFFNTQLLEAASVGDSESVKNALYNGADVDSRDRLGNTALLLAADGGYIECVRILIAYKASVNAVNKFGYTPLMSAVTNSHRKIAGLLIEAGADAKLPNKFGTTPEMYIKAQGFFTMNEYVSDENPAISTMIDDRPSRRGSMAAIHSSPWREEFNQLISKGKTNDAIELLVTYANNKNVEACFLLGSLLLSRGSIEQGLYWAKKAAEMGDSMMKYRTAKVIMDSGSGAGMKDAVSMLKSAIAAGNNFAKTEYAKALVFGNGVPKDNANAYLLFKDAANYDIPEAVYYTGLLEYTGKGTVQDENKGFAKIQSAADMGFFEAQQFINKLNAQKHIKILSSSKVGDRASVKAYLISMGISINMDDPQCDLYTLGNAWNFAYKIEKIKICYPGNGTSQVELIINEEPDVIELTYLKNMFPNVTFTTPSTMIKVPVNNVNNNSSNSTMGFQGFLFTDNNTTVDNKTVENKEDKKEDSKEKNKKDKKKKDKDNKKSKEKIDFSKPVSINK